MQYLAPNLSPETVEEDVIMGCGNPEEPTGHNMGRNAAVLSKLPITTGGTTMKAAASSEHKPSPWLGSWANYDRWLRYNNCWRR